MMKKLLGALKTVALVIVVLAIIGVVAGGGSDDEKSSSSSSKKEESAVSQEAGSADEESKDDEAQADDSEKSSEEDSAKAEEADESPKMAKNSKYEVKINGFRIAEDYDGAPCIAIDYTFTNVSDDSPTSLQLATNITVYQNGVECEEAWFSDGNSDDGYTNKVKAGVSVDVTRAYKLQDTSSDVEVEVAPLFSWTDELLAYQVFQIA